MTYYIRAWRELRLLTQVELANLAQVSAAQVSRFERGDAKPSEPVLQRFASALELPSWRLLLEDPEDVFRKGALRAG